MASKLTYEYIKDFFSKMGYILLSEQYISMDEKLIFKDSAGYMYKLSFTNFKNGNNKLQKFNTNNPYIINNLNVFLKEKNIDGVLVNSKYTGLNHNIIIKDKNDYYMRTNLHSLFVNKKPRIFDARNEYTIENISKWLKKNRSDLILISDEYKNFSSKLSFEDEYGYKYEISLGNLLKIHTPDKFNSNNKHTIDNIKLWCKINNKSFEVLDDKYINNTTNLKCKCKKEKCNEIFYIQWDSILSNSSCSYCAGKQVGISNCIATKNPDIAKEFHPTKNGDLTPYNITCGSGKKVWWKCINGHEWKTTTAHRVEGTSCPYCKLYKGEVKIRNFLEYNKLNFLVQKTFKNLNGLGGGLLSYDFYLPENNFLIEYQGEQHYFPVDFTGKRKIIAEEQFKKQQEHDKRKREYAEKNKIKLLEIPYWDFDKIEEILERELMISKASISL